MKPLNKQRVEQLEKACNFEKGKPSYALVIYSAEMADKISELEVDADFVVALPDNGRGDFNEEYPKEDTGCSLTDVRKSPNIFP